MDICFEDLGLSQELLQAVGDMGFEAPSPIQALSIPHILNGRDVIGQAQTGTGKTAAFGLPLLDRIDAHGRHTQALILCPTRELAIQVAEELAQLAVHKQGVRVVPVYGGQHIGEQLRALKRGAQVVVGTPGRVMDHLERGTLRLEQVGLAVLDEADQMLDMGFREDIESILGKTPEGCQKVFFSATMPPAILELAKRFLRDPESVRVTPKVITVAAIEQVYYEVLPHLKRAALCRMLDTLTFGKAIVFCSTKREVDEVASHLQSRNYQADSLHGDLVQSQRDRVMARFRNGGISVLIATDVAARGLDVDDVDIVINYDIPGDVENYVHRIGRTGRAGRSGTAYTFVTGRDHYRLRDIKRYTKAEIVQGKLPTLQEVTRIRTARLLDEVRATAGQEGLEPYRELAARLAEDGQEPAEAIASLLRLLMQRDFGEAALDADQKDELAMPPRRAPAFDGRRGGKLGKTFPQRRGNMARLFFNVGSRMNVAPRDFVGAIAGEAGIPGRSIGSIEIHERFSFVEIPQDIADTVVTAMNGSQIRGFRVAVEKAQPKR